MRLDPGHHRQWQSRCRSLRRPAAGFWVINPVVLASPASCRRLVAQGRGHGLERYLSNLLDPKRASVDPGATRADPGQWRPARSRPVAARNIALAVVWLLKLSVC